MDYGDGCTAIWMYLMPQNGTTLEVIKMANFGMYILPQKFLKVIVKIIWPVFLQIF